MFVKHTFFDYCYIISLQSKVNGQGVSRIETVAAADVNKGNDRSEGLERLSQIEGLFAKKKRGTRSVSVSRTEIRRNFVASLFSSDVT